MGAPSGDDVGEQLAFELGDEILERQLAALQALYVQRVVRRVRFEAEDFLVERAMLGFEKLELRLDGFDVKIHAGMCPGLAREPRHYSKNTGPG